MRAPAFASWFGFTIAALCLCAARGALANWPTNAAVNVPVCTATGEQSYPRAISDDAGGCYVIWHDLRLPSSQRMYAAHVLASGVTDPAWPVNGLEVCPPSRLLSFPQFAKDGAGGFFAVWDDFRDGVNVYIYAQHVLASGPDPSWPADGLNLTPTYQANYPVVVADGAGGIFVCFGDYRDPITSPDLTVEHVLATAALDPTWPVGGAVVCGASDDQSTPVLAVDGAGGVVVAWRDFRNGSDPDIYVGHILSTGREDSSWPIYGLALATGSTNQDTPGILPDGAGGAFVSWLDSANNGDVYLQHVLGNGVEDPDWYPGGIFFAVGPTAAAYPVLASDGGTGMFLAWIDDRNAGDFDVIVTHVYAWGLGDPSWPLGGLDISPVVNDQIMPALVGDGQGGVIVAWSDPRVVVRDIYAGHVLGSGSIDPFWPADGLAISVAPGQQQHEAIVEDGSGGAIVVWEDWRNTGSYPDLYAQRVQAFGLLGSPEPRLVNVRDVPSDQGGKVTLSWNASFLDTQPPYSLSEYRVFRSLPGNGALREIGAGGGPLALIERPDANHRRLFATRTGVTTYYWEYIGTQPASHFSSNYGYVAPTTSDSMPGDPATTAFIVVAYDDSGRFFASNPDSGHSADNLAPPAPTPFTGVFSPGVGCALAWEASVAPDVAGYFLYRGDTPDFVPGPSNLIATTALTQYTDPVSHTAVYKVSAVDVHANEGSFSTVVPGGTLDASDAAPARLELAPPRPIPARDRVWFDFALPREGPATLAIYDAAGRLVRRMVGGALAAGEHRIDWDMRDAAGERVPSGLYFVRLRTPERELVRRIVAVR